VVALVIAVVHDNDQANAIVFANAANVAAFVSAVVNADVGVLEVSDHDNVFAIAIVNGIKYP
jgi:hypothetical protein